MTGDPADLAEADQYAAAAAEARKVLDRVGDQEPDRWRASYVPEPPAWLLAVIDVHNQLVGAGRHPECVHTTAAVGVIHLAAWAPGFVCCTACADLGLLTALIPPGQHRCDACQSDVDHLHAARIQLGHAIIHYAVCHQCDETSR